MNVAQTTKLNTAVTTSYDSYNSYVTSAISTDTQRYIILSPDEIPNINVEETGKYSYEPDEKCSVVISPVTMASYYKSIYAGD